MARHCPTLAATPLPPLNPLAAGKQWPTTAAVPARWDPVMPASARPAAQASAPLAMSAIRTAVPQRPPSTFMAFTAPGLPEPAIRRSVSPTVASRVATSADPTPLSRPPEREPIGTNDAQTAAS